MRMQGTRLPDGTNPKKPGEYVWMSYKDWKSKPASFTGEGEWHIIDPTNHIGAIRERNGRATHTWIEHKDGTVTFSPSIVMPGGWHGWLRHGVFSN